MQDESQLNKVTVGSEDTPITIGPIVFDASHLRVSIYGKTLRLTPDETLVLKYLAVHADTVSTSDQIGSSIWGVPGDNGLIKAYIRHLRQKIEPDPMHPIYLLTIPEGGYMLVGHDQDETKE